MSEGKMVVGLEIHAELSTNSKIFCGCRNVFGAAPNTHCCPVCAGMPGALPVLNEQVLKYAIRMGHALNCKINERTTLDRKNYFYPDLPKGYQISQDNRPLCENGHLDIMVSGVERRIGITRIHIEEDAGKSVHDAENNTTMLDYNRCGVPLIEIVTAPDLQSAQEAARFMEEIASILLYLGISDAKMQQGSMRADINISITDNNRALGQRTEIKNVNSFGAARRAIDWEVNRQLACLETGGTVRQETRRWDDRLGKSFAMRSKGIAQEYRYVKEVNLNNIVIPAGVIEEIRLGLPEMPLEKSRRFQKEYGILEYEAGLLTKRLPLADFFEETAAHRICSPKLAANWLLGDIASWLNKEGKVLEETPLSSYHLADLLGMIEDETISGTSAKIVLEFLMTEVKAPRQIVEEQGLAQISDLAALNGVVDAVLKTHSSAVSDYCSGKSNALGFLVGQAMKFSGGKANPPLLKKLILQRLGEV